MNKFIILIKFYAVCLYCKYLQHHKSQLLYCCIVIVYSYFYIFILSQNVTILPSSLYKVWYTSIQIYLCTYSIPTKKWYMQCSNIANLNWLISFFLLQNVTLLSPRSLYKAEYIYFLLYWIHIFMEGNVYYIANLNSLKACIVSKCKLYYRQL